MVIKNLTVKKIAISIKNLSLNIPILQSDEQYTLKSTLVHAFSRKSSNISFFKALKNINLEVYYGDKIALIGPNGAGKSTLLKVISGIYMPSMGTIKSSTKVHPVIYKGFLTSQELSGFKAAKAHFLNSKKNLIGFEKYINDVESFCELGDFFYKPVKIYSEGMKTRLLFSILTAFEHDCLAMDEGIGAGDKAFLNKAEKRLQEFIKGSGTLILASHANELLNKFCNRGIVMDKGIIKFDGSLENAINFYESETVESTI